MGRQKQPLVLYRASLHQLRLKKRLYHMDFMTDLTHWHWFIGAVVLGILELLAPGAVFIWMSMSAISVGTIVFFMPDLGWGSQVIAFSILSIITVVCARVFISKRNSQSDHPLLNEKSAQYVGKTYSLSQDSQNGIGKIKIGDTLWNVEIDTDAKTGTAIKIIEAKGVLLKGEITQ